MILELVLIVAILGIFVIIVRRLPDALNEGKQSTKTQPIAKTKSVASAAIQDQTPWYQRLGSLLGFTDDAPAPPAKTTDVAAPVSATAITDETLLKEGDAYLQDGKFKEAERSYLRAVAKNPKNPKLYNRLGAIYLRQRNYSDALQAFEAARDLDDSKASRHYNVALAAWQLNNLSKARDAIARAISLNPNAQKYQDLKKQIEEGKSA